MIKTKVLSAMNDACQKKNASDASVLTTMQGMCKGRVGWVAPDKLRPANKLVPLERLFSINHYAGEVQYCIDDFVVKNMDELSTAITELIGRSGVAELREMAAADEERKADVPTKGVKRKKTVARGFRDDLTKLLETLHSTDLHYIRCLKPNQSLQPGDWDRSFMASQLAYSGTLEVAKVRASGYNIRRPLVGFVIRFALCCKEPKEVKLLPNMKQKVERIMSECSVPSKSFRVGKTMVFLKEGVLPKLEARFDERTAKTTHLIRMQTLIGFKARRMFMRKMLIGHLVIAYNAARDEPSDLRKAKILLAVMHRIEKGALEDTIGDQYSQAKLLREELMRQHMQLALPGAIEKAFKEFSSLFSNLRGAVTSSAASVSEAAVTGLRRKASVLSMPRGSTTKRSSAAANFKAAVNAVNSKGAEELRAQKVLLDARALALDEREAALVAREKSAEELESSVAKREEELKERETAIQINTAKLEGVREKQSAEHAASLAVANEQAAQMRELNEADRKHAREEQERMQAMIDGLQSDLQERLLAAQRSEDVVKELELEKQMGALERDKEKRAHVDFIASLKAEEHEMRDEIEREKEEKKELKKEIEEKLTDIEKKECEAQEAKAAADELRAKHEAAEAAAERAAEEKRKLDEQMKREEALAKETRKLEEEKDRDRQRRMQVLEIQAMQPIRDACNKEKKERTYTFWFVDAQMLRDWDVKKDGLTPPVHQRLKMRSGMLKPIPIEKLQAFQRKYTEDFLAVSHRWNHPDAPDAEGEQFKNVQQHLKTAKGRKIKWVWYDFWCMPQNKQGYTRTSEEEIKFDHMLSEMSILYIGMSVVVLLDTAYISRFWCVNLALEAPIHGHAVTLHVHPRACRDASCWRLTLASRVTFVQDPL